MCGPKRDRIRSNYSVLVPSNDSQPFFTLVQPSRPYPPPDPLYWPIVRRWRELWWRSGKHRGGSAGDGVSQGIAEENCADFELNLKEKITCYSCGGESIGVVLTIMSSI